MNKIEMAIATVISLALTGAVGLLIVSVGEVAATLL